MTATTSSAEDGTPDPGHEPLHTPTPVAPDAGDALLVGMASPDRCTECGAEMALDQRYCVECGNRRGPARFSLSRSSRTSVAVVPQAPRGSTRPAGMLLAATGIVIALLGLGVGVLIGHDGKAKTVKVLVSGAASSGSASKTGSATGGTSTGSSSSGTSTSKTKTNFFGN
jgi:hypothetical protein